MNKYKLIRILCILVFFISLSIWGYTRLIYLDAYVTYSDLERKVVKEIPQEEKDENENSTIPQIEIDSEKLLDINKDYICWLSACDNKVSYPVVKAKDNEEYLHRTFFGDKSFVGAIFADYRCELSDFHTIIYGHSMKNKTMFRLIADYTKESFAKENPVFYIYTDWGGAKYEIFSVCVVKETDLPMAVGTVETKERQALIERLKNDSLINFNLTPNTTDNIISLVTCDVKDDSYRVVLSGVLTDYELYEE